MVSSFNFAAKLSRSFHSINLSVVTDYALPPDLMCDRGSHGNQGFIHVIFKTPKENGDSDYDWWPEHTIIEGHGMQGLIHGSFKTPKENDDSKKKAEVTTVECKRSDALVTGRISGSLNKYVMTTVVGLDALSAPTGLTNKLIVGSEEWMKKAAESYTIRVACINTIVFAAAIILS